MASGGRDVVVGGEDGEGGEEMAVLMAVLMAVEMLRRLRKFRLNNLWPKISSTAPVNV
jgi:hypothetical protein